MIRLLMAAACALSAGAAFAETFEVKEPETREGAVEVEWNNAIFLSDVNVGDTRSAHEIGVSLGVITGWKSGLTIELENERGNGPSVEGGAWENTFVLIGSETIFDISTPYPGLGAVEEEEDGFALALYAAAEVSDGDIALETGPIFGYTAGPIEAVLDTFLVFPLSGGDNTGFNYAASVTYEIVDDVSAGVEFHGAFGDVFDDSGTNSEDQHYIGPVISAGFDVDERRELGVHLGGFFGLNSDTPDFALAINFELEIN